MGGGFRELEEGRACGLLPGALLLLIDRSSSGWVLLKVDLPTPKSQCEPPISPTGLRWGWEHRIMDTPTRQLAGEYSSPGHRHRQPEWQGTGGHDSQGAWGGGFPLCQRVSAKEPKPPPRALEQSRPPRLGSGLSCS